MADYLRFKGAKTITRKTGTDMRLVRNPRGGDTTQIKQWWGLKQTVSYVKCAVFNVTASVGELKLVIPTDPETTEVWISHDGDGNFTFPYTRAIDRVAVFNADFSELYREYQFSRISGGPTLTRTVNSYPAAGTSITSVTINGPASATAGTPSVAFSAAIEGDAGNLTYSWTSSDGSAVFSAQTAQSTTVNFSAAGSPTVSCQVSSGDANVSDSPQSGTSAAITVAAAFSTRVAGANFSYDVTVVDDNGTDVYALDGSNQAGVAGSVGDSFHFDLSDASLSGHPLKIYTDAGKTTEVTVGVEQVGTDLLFTPPIAGTFSYQCQNHAGMGGTITVN